MAITLDSCSFTSNDPDSTVVSWYHNIGNGANRAFFVSSALRASTISSITFNNIPLTLVKAEMPGVDVVSEIWYLPTASIPVPGNYPVQVNFSPTQKGCFASTSFFNVKAIRGSYSSYGSGTIAGGITVPTELGDAVFDIMALEYPVSLTPKQTELWTDISSVNSGGGSIAIATSSETTMDWRMTSAEIYATIALVLEPIKFITPEYNYFNQMEMPGLILCNPNKSEICALGLAYGIKNTLRYNALSELSFSYARVTGSETTYDAIQGKRVVLVDNVGYYIIQSCPEDLSGGTPIKKISCQSLEVELTSRRLTGFAGTYEFETLLRTILKLIPTWSVGDIDPQLQISANPPAGLQRTFESNNLTLYNFMMSTMEKAYGCIFLFDTFSKTVSAIPNTTPSIPNTNIYLSLENIMSELEFTEITEELCTGMYCYGGDGLDISGVNPLGTKVIYNFQHFKNTDWMTSELISALTSWEGEIIVQQPIYAEEMTRLNNENVILMNLVDEYDALLANYASVIEERKAKLTLTPPDNDVSNENIQIAELELDLASTLVAIEAEQNAINYIEINLRKISTSLAFSESFVYIGFQKIVSATGDALVVLQASWEESCCIKSLTYPKFNSSLLSKSSVETINSFFQQAIGDNAILLGYLDALLTPVTFVHPTDVEIALIDARTVSEYSIINTLYLFLQDIIPNTSTTDSLSSIEAKLRAFVETTGDNILGIIYFTPNMTEAEYMELSNYIYENTYTNENIKAREGATLQETMENYQTSAQQLYDQSIPAINRVSVPRYEFKGTFSNMLALKEFVPFTNEMDLGKVMTIGKDNDLSIIVILLELAISYDNPSDFGLTFSNSLRLDDSRYIYGDILGAAAQLGSNQSAITGAGTPTLSTSTMAIVDISIHTQTANYTLILDDTNCLVRMDVSTANTLTVPPNSSVAFPIGTRLAIGQQGTGQTTVTPGSGVTITSYESALKLAGQYAMCLLVKVATDVWGLEGDVVA
jgi:hypothetical protein